MSKGSFFPSVVYVLTFFILYFKFTKLHKWKLFLTIILSLFLFVVSTYEIWGNLNFEKGFDANQTSAESLLKVDTLRRNISDISQQKNTSEVFASIYFSGNRIYSTEMMLDWRLQIWQDIVYDLYEKNQILFGYGYNEIIPIMDDSQRRGTDGTNENVHNYFFNVLARGGIVQLLIIFLFMIFMFIEIKN
jgi:O-antigen ligase